MEEITIPCKKYDGPGRGRKLCSQCKSSVGVRIQVCRCGKKFASGEDKVVELTEEQRDLALYLSNLGKTPMDRVVFTPTNYPIISLENVTRDSVFDWADNVIDYGKQHLQIYTIEALKYILGQTVGYDSAKYAEGVKLLKVWKDSLF